MQWPPDLNTREQKMRSAMGLTIKRDGWYKSINGKTRYICRRAPLSIAIAELQERIKSYQAGDPPRRIRAVLTVERLAEQFIEAIRIRMETGVPKKLRRRTFEDYVDVLDRFVECIGPDKLAERIGPDEFTKFVLTLAGRAKSTLRREIQYVDRLFNWAGPGKRSMNLIPFARRGPDWIKPSDDEIAGDGDKTYTPAQLRAAFAAVEDNPMLYAAAHLGLNCAFIPIDIGTLPESLLDLESGIIRFPRGKSGVKRMCILLPQTITAIHGWLRQRENLKCQIGAAGLLFRTRHGLPLARTLTNEASGSGYDHNALTTTWGRNVGLPFSGLRTTFATIADEWPDQRAIDVVMGHSVGRVSGHIRSIHYAKQINPERVRRLVLHVWPLAFGQGVQNSAAATQQHGLLSAPTSRAG